MTLEHWLWVLGGYLAGTFPSTYLVSRAKGATGVIAASHRKASEADAHIVMSERLGGGWAALAATLDVAKGMVYPLAARRFGHLPDSWLAMAGVAVVVGHSFPFYARPMAGRGLAATAGVYLALLPVEMVIAGAIMLAGIIARTSGIASTVGFGGVPLVAWIQGQPVPFVAMGAAIFAVILIRRLEGVGTVVEEAHVSWPRAILWRTVFDTSGQPSETREPEVKGREA